MDMAKKINLTAWIAIVCLIVAGILMGVIRLQPVTPKPVANKAMMGVLKMSGGKVVAGDSADKTLTAAGMRLIIGLIRGDSSAVFDDSCWFAIGSDGTVTDTSMTALQDTTPVACAVADSCIIAATSITWWKTWGTSAANDTWREVGFFNDSGATMFDRRTGEWGLKTTADTFMIYFRYRVNQ